MMTPQKPRTIQAKVFRPDMDFTGKRVDQAEATIPEDRELVALSAGGEREAFELIYRRHCARVYGLCLRLTADSTEADILTQDTFVRAWFSIAGFRGQGSLGGWLGRTAVNLWRDKLRSGKRARRLRDDLARETQHLTGTLAGNPTGGQAGVIPLLTGVDLERCIPRLPDGGRAVFVLHDVEGYTHREIAGLLGVATGTVKAQLHRARGLLRRMLSEDRKDSHETR